MCKTASDYIKYKLGFIFNIIIYFYIHVFQTHSELMKMVMLENPKPLIRGMSENLINMISKMLRKNAILRPSTELLISSPCLSKNVVKIYLNVGRCIPISKNELAPQVFLNFLKPKFATLLEKFQISFNFTARHESGLDDKFYLFFTDSKIFLQLFIVSKINTRLFF